MASCSTDFRERFRRPRVSMIFLSGSEPSSIWRSGWMSPKTRFAIDRRGRVRVIPIKSAREVEKMRLACRTASEVLDRVSEIVRPGVSTKEVDEAAADFMQEAGVKSAFLGYRLGHRVFPGNICISLNDEIVHGIGSQRRTQHGDVVKLDIGVIQEGWGSDTACNVPVGNI